MAHDESPSGRLDRAHTFTGAGSTAEIVSDVAIHPDGVLRGRIFDASGGRMAPGVAGLRVRFFRGRRAAAVTTSGPRGEFALKGLSGGLYLVVVDVVLEGAYAAPRRLYRVWTSSSAPPHALGEMGVPIAAPIVRGQFLSPFPIMSLQQAAIVTGIATGAIAAPVIYHNARLDNRLPSSP